MRPASGCDQEMSWLAGLATMLLCMAFGANAVAIKISLAGMGVFTAATLRFAVAALVIIGWAKLTGRPLTLNKGQFGPLVMVTAIFVVQLSMVYCGLSKTYVSRGTLLINLQPFFVLFLAHLFIPGDRISLRKVLGLVMGFAGVVFVFWEGEDVAADLRTGDALLLGASFIWACNATYVKRIIHAYRPFQIVLYPMLLALPVFLIEALVWDTNMVVRLDGPIVVSMLYQSLVTASFGFVAWNYMLQRYGAVALHSFLFVMPIAGVTLGGLLLGEPLPPKLMLALFLIAAGLLVLHYKSPRRLPFLTVTRDL